MVRLPGTPLVNAVTLMGSSLEPRDFPQVWVLLHLPPQRQPRGRVKKITKEQ